MHTVRCSERLQEDIQDYTAARDSMYPSEAFPVRQLLVQDQHLCPVPDGRSRHAAILEVDRPDRVAECQV